jgi:hypothetical protein
MDSWWVRRPEIPEKKDLSIADLPPFILALLFKEPNLINYFNDLR